MKKLLIVNDNLELGGIQKALINLLKAMNKEYEITLFLLHRSGALLAEVPENVQVLSANRWLGVLGAHRSRLKRKKIEYLWKGFLCVLAKIVSKSFAVKVAGLFQRKITGYDTAISFSHASCEPMLTSCCAELVLGKVDAKTKICFIHCDYSYESNHSQYTNRLYSRFSRIACCSESVRRRFLEVIPHMEGKTYAVRNFFDRSFGDDESSYEYDQDFINIVSVARMTEEKGLERAVQAVASCGRSDIRYYIVGDGPERENIENAIKKGGVQESVFLLGSSDVPARYMKKADYLFVPSFHEAAPMVFDEAKLLGTCVLTTDTTSAKEMIAREDGFICENSNEGLVQMLCRIEKADKKAKTEVTNDLQRKQFIKLLEEK